MFNVTGTTTQYPDKLLTAEVAATRLKITAETLTHFADAGLAPHRAIHNVGIEKLDR